MTFKKNVVLILTIACWRVSLLYQGLHAEGYTFSFKIVLLYDT